jgi:GH15 family glucan-1,4-alpha-glucosidase
MVRELPLGNGNLLVNFDRRYGLRDLYWPRVGQENHTRGDLSRFGVWVDGQFAWLEDDGWTRDLRYVADTLVTDVTCRHDALGVTLRFADCVDFDRDIFIRRVTVTNHRDSTREVRLFQHFDSHLSGTGDGDTAYYDPTHRGLVHYKGKRYVMICGRGPNGMGLDSFACGTKEVAGQEGTWRNAEGGALSRNLIAQGSVDSVGALYLGVDARASVEVFFWFCLGESYDAVRVLHSMVVDRSPELFHDRTLRYWRWWVSADCPDLTPLGEDLGELYRRSLLILRTQVDNGGAVLAANDADILQFGRDTYSYMWPRDGALAAYAFTLNGHTEITRRFFEFCNTVKQRSGYLLHKYNPDGSPGSSWLPWSTPEGQLMLPIQEDETGLVLWAAWQSFKRYRNVEFVRPLIHPLVRNAADFMVAFRHAATGLPDASYDLWEERRGILLYTVAAVVAGLRAAANFMREAGLDELERRYRDAAEEMRDAACTHMFDETENRFVRMVTVGKDGTLTRDMTVDASMYGAVQFELLPPDDRRLASTMAAVEQRLWVKTPIGGLARYENDYYQQVSRDIGNVPGNPWFICTLWLADWYRVRARSRVDLERARQLLQWCHDHALPSGVMAEQIDPYTGSPLSVSPLSWSHAAFIQTAHGYLEQWRALPE